MRTGRNAHRSHAATENGCNWWRLWSFPCMQKKITMSLYLLSSPMYWSVTFPLTAATSLKPGTESNERENYTLPVLWTWSHQERIIFSSTAIRFHKSYKWSKFKKKNNKITRLVGETQGIVSRPEFVRLWHPPAVTIIKKKKTSYLSLSIFSFNN